MADFLTSLVEFRRRYPDEAVCAASILNARWPAAFSCRACAHNSPLKKCRRAHAGYRSITGTARLHGKTALEAISQLLTGPPQPTPAT